MIPPDMQQATEPTTTERELLGEWRVQRVDGLLPPWGISKRIGPAGGVTRLFGVPGRPARAVRRFGLGAVQRIAPLKSMFMAEARGETGALPKLLQGVTV